MTDLLCVAGLPLAFNLAHAPPCQPTHPQDTMSLLELSLALSSTTTGTNAAVNAALSASALSPARLPPAAAAAAAAARAAPVAKASNAGARVARTAASTPSPEGPAGVPEGQSESPRSLSRCWGRIGWQSALTCLSHREVRVDRAQRFSKR